MARLRDILLSGALGAAKGYSEGAQSDIPGVGLASGVSQGFGVGSSLAKQRQDQEKEQRRRALIDMVRNAPPDQRVTIARNVAYELDPEVGLKDELSRGAEADKSKLQPDEKFLDEATSALLAKEAGLALPQGSRIPKASESAIRSVAGIRAQKSAKAESSERANISVASDLRKEFINRPEVKDAVTVGTQIKSMDSLLSSALSGNQKNQLALDQALITMYNKLSDPTSVVRESEYARTPENLPMTNRVLGALQKVASGGAGLTNEDRAALVLGAKIIGNERGSQFNQTRSGYEALADKMKVNRDLITGTLPAFEAYDVGGGQTAPMAKPSFSTEAEAEAAARAGKIKPGDKISIGGVSGTWE